MKIERELDGRSALKLDVFVLKEFQNKKTPGFPRFIAAGRTNHLKYLVLQLVGPDINKLRRCLPGKKFCLSTALRLCQQTLKRIETLHDAGWLSRDIKASNFTVGRTKDSGTVYMLDFGFARRFRDRKGHAYAPSRSAALLGSIYYASMAAHAFRDQCRRDDVESWFYMSCELIKGPLPWASLDPKTDYNLIGEWKRYARFGGREELLRDVPSEFDRILDLIDDIKFYERPDYHALSCLIEGIFTRLDLNRNAPFEWQCDPFLVQKAAMIGDQGKSQEISYRIRPGSTSDNVEVVSCNTSLEMMELIKDQCQSTEVNATACSNEQQTITSKVSCNTSLEMMELIKDQCQSTEVNATACSNEQQTITSKVD
ncbi:Tau-tubulin kinase 1 [Toxocara canis]|uniref:Tau-tubulin kinase 1 n=1 Tax=Toxocara canis TaxID=6265 RepID=A0A0B2VI03_TOXCA|nr:Tau-tubulin kinase 1 [Toxocara canis]